MKNKTKATIDTAIILLSLTVLSAYTFPVSSTNPIEEWAIIVTGDPNNSFYEISRMVYDTLISCGYTHYSIYYMDVIERPHPPMDEYATPATVQQAIQNWLAAHADYNDLCVIYFNNHGAPGYFACNETPIYYSEVNTWLSGINCGRLIFIIEACFSGSAIHYLSAPNRILIASSDECTMSYVGLFSSEFFPRLPYMNIGKAFNESAFSVWNQTRCEPGKPCLPFEQIPVIDDNGDGAYHTFFLPQYGDGYLSFLTDINPQKMVTLMVNTYWGSGQLTGAKVWVDTGLCFTSPVEIIANKGIHNIKAETTFLVPAGPGLYWIFSFTNWENGSTNNPRAITLTQDTTLTAYYKRSKYPIGDW